MTERSVVGMFTGAGGLDLGFELAGCAHLRAMDWEPWAVRTLKRNRSEWHVDEADAREWDTDEASDVLIAGPPCQGYSLGGNRDATDARNLLYREVLRIAREKKPRVVVIENVLNLRTLKHPESGRPFNETIQAELEALGYQVFSDVFRMANHGVPQTRRRWLFVGFLGGAPQGYHLPLAGGEETIRPWLYDLGQGAGKELANHNPVWGFKSTVHVATGEPVGPRDEAVVVRFSRTASDGNPIRSFDAPFPAVDTATVWGWARGNVSAERVEKDRGSGSKFVRNPEATVRLWRVQASELRAMTHRELARLQTFPDDWAFEGQSLRDVQLQIGNAVPVEFARRVGLNIVKALDALDRGVPFASEEMGLLFA